MTVIDNSAFESLDALLDDPFAICSVILDAEGRAVDYRFLRVGPGFEEAAGLRDAEGRTVLEVMPGVEQSWIDICGRVALERAPVRSIRGPSLGGRECEVAVVPLDPPGCFAMVLRGAAGQRRAEADRTAALDPERRLKELAHRVMNGFAILSASVSMETRAAPPESRAALQRVQGRVQALAGLYRRLDGGSQADRIDVAGFLAGNLEGFRASLAAPIGVTVTADLAPLTLPTRAALPLALVVNELLTNAVKHAFGPGRSGTVHVSLREEGGRCRLCVADDGGGMGEGAAAGAGCGLVAAFVAELGGELSVETGPKGTCVTVAFPA